jgi:hypothetical protein
MIRTIVFSTQYSAFFCDCGAGDPTTSSQPACKCLSPIDQRKINALYRKGMTKPLVPDLSHSTFKLTPADSAQLASLWHVKSSRQVMEAIVQTGRAAKWVDILLNRVRACFKISRPSQLLLSAHDASRSICSYADMRSQVKDQWTSSPLISWAASTSMEKVASFQPSSFQAKMSTQPSMENLKRAFLSSNGAYRFAISADYRGRVVLIEPDGLVFCTFLPLVNRPDHSFLDHALPRSSASIVGIGKLDFDPVGVKHSSTCDNALIVWGTHEAAIVILDEYCCSIEKVVHLEVGLRSVETNSDVVMECDWVPGRYLTAMVRCLHSLSLFEMSMDDTILPVSSYQAGSEISLRGAVVVEACDKSMLTQLTLYVLLGSGKLHQFELATDAEGHIRMTISLGNAAEDSASEKLLLQRDGLQLSFLTQSRILLCQCKLGGVLALLIDESGKNITGTFDMLPHVLPVKEVDREGSNVCPIGAPYTHWADLGAVGKDGFISFTAVCVGKRGAKGNAVLYLRYNQYGTSVEELACSNNDSGSSPAVSVEGLAVFTAPTAVSCVGSLDLEERLLFTENSAVASIMTDGSVHFYTDQRGASLTAAPYETDQMDKKYFVPQTTVPLLAYEGFEHASDGNDVIYLGPTLGRYEQVVIIRHRNWLSSLTFFYSSQLGRDSTQAKSR